MRKLVCGVGVNDADYEVYKVNGKVCRYYTTWCSMLRRCYSKKHLVNRSTYKGCEVCTEWIYFMSFRSWMGSQDWESKQLDKDILGDGKLYSPQTCCFVEPWLNMLFNTSPSNRGEYPVGVSLRKDTGKFSAHISINNQKKSLGCFDTPEESHQIYLMERKVYVTEKMISYPNERIKQAVLDKVNQPCVCKWCK